MSESTFTPSSSSTVDDELDELLRADPDAAETDEERLQAWATVLGDRLQKRLPLIRKAREYFNSEQPTRFASQAWTDTFGEVYNELRTNYLPRTIGVATTRMEVQGARRRGAKKMHRGAADIWDRCELDIGAPILHDDLLVTGYAYTLTWPDDDGLARITVEDPAEAIVARDPADWRRVLAGLRCYREVGGQWRATVWTPDLLVDLVGGDSVMPGSWAIEGEIKENPYDRVPLNEFVNDPTVRWKGRSDLRDLYSLQDGLDKIGMDKFVASEFTSFRQRVLMNAEIPTDEDDNPIPLPELGIHRWLSIEGASEEGEGSGATPSIVELSASDLANYTELEKGIKSDIAALSCTPPQHLLGATGNVGESGLSDATEALVSRVRRRCTWAGRGWSNTMDLAMQIDGVDDAEDEAGGRLVTVWRNVEVGTMAQHADALSKYSGVKIPDVAVWELAGATEDEVERWTKLAEEQALREGTSFGVGFGDGMPPEPSDGEPPEPVDPAPAVDPEPAVA